MSKPIFHAIHTLINHLYHLFQGCIDRLCPLSKFEKLYGESMEEDWDQVCGEEIQERLIDFGERK